MFFGSAFPGFDKGVLSVFEARRQSSNQFNRDRMVIREALQGLGESLIGTLGREHALAFEVSPHVPCIFNQNRVDEIVLFITRTAEQRKAIAPLIESRFSLPEQVAGLPVHQQHLFLGVRVSLEGCEIGLMAHSRAWLDVMNLLNRCRQSAEALELVRLVRSLPEAHQFRVAPDCLVPARDFDVGHLEQLEHAVLGHSFLIRIGRMAAPGAPEVMGPALRSHVADTLTRLLPLWDFWAWRPASNWLLPESQVPGDASASSRADSPVQVSSGGGAVNFRVGERVRIDSGVFHDREGVVDEIDGRGQVRVLVGKVALRLDARHLAPVGRTPRTPQRM